MSRQIKIFDTTLRDGEQSPGASMSVEQKIEMAIALEDLGVDRIEAGFPVSSPVQFEAVEKISKKLQKATIVALSRCVEKDIDAARDSLAPAKHKMLHTFISTSPLHRDYKLKMSKEKVLDVIAKRLDYSRKFFDLIEFSLEDATRTEPEFIYDVIRTVIKHGGTTVNIGDTVGYMMPVEYGDLIKGIIENVPEVKNIDLSAHCHNDLGLAVANSIAAVMNGATQVEVTMNGIGERAGNCSLEELIMSFNVRKDLLDVTTGINTKLLYPTSKILQNITGLIVPRNKPILGDNAFAHESGIHQDGYLKHRETYEIMKPEQIGRSVESLVMGRHSGQHAFKKKLEQYHLELSPEQFQQAFESFTVVADKKKEVYDEDIINIVSSILGTFEGGFQMIYFHTYTGNTLMPSATVKLMRGNDEFTGSAHGDGPVDALFQAIDAALGTKCTLKEYVIQAIGSGRDALGHVKLSLVFEGEGDEYAGKGAATDIIEASGLAYLNAVNRHYLQGGQAIPVLHGM